MKKFRFDKKNVILTGASSGIGKQMAKVLVEKYGCTVYAVARNEEKLNAAENEISAEKFVPFCFDVGSAGDWQRLRTSLSEKGVIADVLINCAGVLPKFSPFENTGVEKIEEIMRTNFFSQVYSAKTFLCDIKKNGGGIINFSSSSSLCPFALVSSYCASKAAAERFCECLAEENRDILVSCVMPGFIKTDIMRNQTASDKEKKIIDKISGNCEKSVNKILNRIIRRKRRIIVGADAHFMNFAFRFFPSLAPRLITKILKKSNMRIFN